MVLPADFADGRCAGDWGGLPVPEAGFTIEEDVVRRF